MQRDLLYLICIILGFAIFFHFKFNYEAPENVNNIPNKTNNVVTQNFKSENSDTGIRQDINSDPYVVKVNLPVELSGKTREEVYDIRRGYIRTSIFDSKEYNPSDQVFGEIIDGKPWYAADICEDDVTRLASVTGPSEESRFINNPTMLVALEYPFLWYDVKDKDFCVSHENLMIPNYIAYSKSKNLITVKYSSLPFETQKPFFYQFNGLNAVDLGYKYMYVDLLKSTFKPNFSDKSNNPSTNVQEFQNFIHLGYSCRREGGCNNGSPRQPNLEFNTYEGEGEGEIYIKLWKTKPLTVLQKPDIAEKIIIER